MITDGRFSGGDARDGVIGHVSPQAAAGADRPGAQGTRIGWTHPGAQSSEYIVLRCGTRRTALRKNSKPAEGETGRRCRGIRRDGHQRRHRHLILKW